MRIAAITMVYRDYWALAQWYRHYAAQLGAANLYIVSHGSDPKISELCPGSSVITIPRESFDGFDRERSEMLNAFQLALLKVYDWVLRTDADELICWDPQRYDGLADVFAQNAEFPVLTALGMDLVAMSASTVGEPFQDVRDAGFSGHYSKAFALRIPAGLNLHGVKVAPRNLQRFPFHMPKGLFLVHLKYANREALFDANTVRHQVATSKGIGLPGTAWKEAYAETENFFETFESKELLPWDDAEEQAHAFFSDKPSRIERYSVIKTRVRKWPYRTVLPDWFATL
ncbi:MAG: glycosyltransferase family 2 protein [Shimia thalassica]|uniref:glycosyltransferase family 2 protein n=1 Tax=Shimia thalassica TaxID=1715693 RepID=UPI003296978A